MEKQVGEMIAQRYYDHIIDLTMKNDQMTNVKKTNIRRVLYFCWCT